MKLSRLEYTKKLYPHWLDRNDESNFVKHLKVINHQQYDLYHKLKTLDWARMLEKPIQIWKYQSEPNNYTMNFKVGIKYLKEINIYKNPKINKEGLIDEYDELIVHKQYPNDDVNIFEYSHNDTSNLIIPRDTYIIEVYTWDDYHFIKGFPENDYLFYNELDYKFNESFLKINLEEISYSKYLTFRVHMDKIKLIEIFKNDERIYIEDFILEGYNNRKLYSTDFSYQYFDYSSYDSFDDVYEIENPDANTRIIYRANIEKDEYVFRLLLSDEDFNLIFDYSNLINEYPNTEKYILSYDEIEPSEETLDTIVIIKENGIYNAYKTIQNADTYSFELVKSNLDYDYGNLKDNYDLFVTVFSKGGRCAKQDIINFDEVLSKNYTIEGCLDTIYEVDDCVIVNQLPTPSLHTFGKLLVVKEDGKYNGYKTLLNKETGMYYYSLLLEDIEYSTIELPKGDRVYKKRYSGYDDILGDCFEHDYSLDLIGHLFNIHRYKFKPIPHKNPYFYSRTYPLYNNRYTEDDYHYMKRIQYYIQNYNKIYFPVLEFWKYYHTDSTLVNRKAHLGEQDRTYFRTNYDSTCLDKNGKIINVAETLIEEEFDDDATISSYENIELVTESTSTGYVDNYVYYNVNKATVTIGSSNPINVQGYDSTWYEAIIVNNVFVVPNTNYRIRYGVTDNNKPVTMRMICFNRKGQKLHSIPITDESNNLDDSDYPTTEGYDYIDRIINMPSDTAYIVLVLESDDTFDFADVTFQRETVTGFDNKYMKSSLNWNSCVYDLYVNYNDIPVNLILEDSNRFNLLFRRSLPLTKIGFLNVRMGEGFNNALDVSSSSNVKIINYFGASDKHYINDNSYEFLIENYLEGGKEYMVKFYCKNYDFTSIEEGNNSDYLISSKFEFYDENYELISEYEFGDDVDSQVEAKVNYKITAPTGTKNGRLVIESEEEFECWGISLKEHIEE